MYKDILVKFKSATEPVLYTTNILNLLVSDPDVDYICLAETGEVIYTCEDGLNIPCGVPGGRYWEPQPDSVEIETDCTYKNTEESDLSELPFV